MGAQMIRTTLRVETMLIKYNDAGKVGDELRDDLNTIIIPVSSEWWACPFLLWGLISWSRYALHDQLQPWLFMLQSSFKYCIIWTFTACRVTRAALLGNKND